MEKEALKRKIEDTTQKQNKIQDSFNSKSYLSENSARAKLITKNISEITNHTRSLKTVDLRT